MILSHQGLPPLHATTQASHPEPWFRPRLLCQPPRPKQPLSHLKAKQRQTAVRQNGQLSRPPAANRPGRPVIQKHCRAAITRRIRQAASSFRSGWSFSLPYSLVPESLQQSSCWCCAQDPGILLEAPFSWAHCLSDLAQEIEINQDRAQSFEAAHWWLPRWNTGWYQSQPEDSAVFRMDWKYR